MNHSLVSTVTRNIKQLIERNLNPLSYLRSIDKAYYLGVLSRYEYKQIQANVRQSTKRG